MGIKTDYNSRIFSVGCELKEMSFLRKYKNSSDQQIRVGNVRWSMIKTNPKVGTDKFQMMTGIAGTIVDVETDRLTVRFDSGHKLPHNHLYILSEGETEVDHITGGVIDNGIQVGLPFLTTHADLQTLG